MKVITVLQPWATLLVTGKKHIETRSWKTNYRGEILIHAGKKDPLFGFCMMTDDTKKRVFRVLGLPEIFNRFQKFPTGEILGKAILADCVLIDKEIAALIKEQRPDEYAFGDTTMICPNCESAAVINPYRKGRELYPHCPWCGQKLKEAEDETEKENQQAE